MWARMAGRSQPGGSVAVASPQSASPASFDSSKRARSAMTFKATTGGGTISARSVRKHSLSCLSSGDYARKARPFVAHPHALAITWRTLFDCASLKVAAAAATGRRARECG